MTIHLGWWLAPLLVTIAAFTLAFVCAPTPRDDRDLGAAFAGALLGAAAMTISVVAWLAWSLHA